MKISVIIPVYNAQNYLNQCLTSVLNQTIKEIEVICIDDGSNDASADIVKSFMRDDDRIKFYQQSNQGSGVARNLGLNKCSGEFVCFMDADDYYPSSEILERLYESAKKNSVEIAGGSFACFSKSQDGLVQNFGESFEGYVFPNDEVIDYRDYQFDYGYHRFIYSTKLIKKNNITFPDYLRFQDPVFFTRCMIAAGSFAANKFISYAYRTSGKKLQWNEKKVLGLLHGLKDNFSLALKYNLPILMELTKTRLVQHITSIKQIQTAEVLETLNSLIEYAGDELKHFLKVHRLYFSKKGHFSPKISVVIPIYNAGCYLRECLLSLLNQTFEDFELVCVNDGSTDNSLDILKEFSTLDNRIKILDKVNTGYGDSVNIGIDSSNAKYLSIVEPDDFVSKEFLEVLYNEISYFNTDFVKADFFLYWANGQKKRYYHCIDDFNKYGITITNFTDPNLSPSVVANWSGLYSLEFIKKNNIKHQTTPGASFQDQSFYYQIILHASSARYIKRALYYYRQDNENSSVNNYNKATAIFGEYAYIEKNILSNNDHNVDAVLIKKKYNSLKYNLEKLNESDRPAFLSKIAREIQNDLNKDRIKRNYFNFYTWYLIKSIITKYKLKISHEQIEDNIYLACCFDSNYFKQFMAFVHSINYNKDSTTKIHLYAVHDKSVTNKQKSSIRSLERNDFTINLVEFNLKQMVETTISHITPTTYLRLKLPSLLPAEVEKVLYLDLDLIVNCDLSDLFKISLEKYAVAGSLAAGYLLNNHKKLYQELGLKSLRNYVNAGVLLMNLKKLRYENAENQWNELICKSFPSMDQDIINITLQNEILIIPPRYNFMSKYYNGIARGEQEFESVYSNYEMSSALNNPFIIHYADKIKPWDNISSPLAFYWWFHAISSNAETIYGLFKKINSKNVLNLVRQARPILKYSNPELKRTYLFMKKNYQLLKSIIKS